MSPTEVLVPYSTVYSTLNSLAPGGDKYSRSLLTICGVGELLILELGSTNYVCYTVHLNINQPVGTNSPVGRSLTFSASALEARPEYDSRLYPMMSCLFSTVLSKQKKLKPTCRQYKNIQMFC